MATISKEDAETLLTFVYFEKTNSRLKHPIMDVEANVICMKQREDHEGLFDGLVRFEKGKDPVQFFFILDEIIQHIELGEPWNKTRHEVHITLPLVREMSHD